MGKGLQPIKDMELGVQEQCTEDEIQQCYKGWTDSEKKKNARGQETSKEALTEISVQSKNGPK